MVFDDFKDRPAPQGIPARSGAAPAPGFLARVSPGVATVGIGFLLATGIALGAGATTKLPPAGTSPAQSAAVRAAVITYLAAQSQPPSAPASATPAPAPPAGAATPAPVVAPVTTEPAEVA